MIKRKVFWAIFWFLIALIIVFIALFINYIVPQQKSRTLYFQDIPFKDNYNSTFKMDVRFTTEKFDFFVRDRIHVHVIINRINNNSIYPLFSIFFGLVTTEGHFIPYPNSLGRGNLHRLIPDYYYLDYDTYLDFSTKYSCRIILFYYNTTTNTPIEDEQFVGPILEVQPVSVELQNEAMNTTIAFSLIVIVFTLVIIWITWIDKYDSLYHSYQTGQQWQGLKKIIQKLKRK